MFAIISSVNSALYRKFVPILSATFISAVTVVPASLVAIAINPQHLAAQNLTDGGLSLIHI